MPEIMEKGLRGCMAMLIIVAYAPDAHCSLLDARCSMMVMLIIAVAYAPDARQHQRKLGLACPLSHTPAPFQTRSRTEGNVLSMSLKYNFEAERGLIILLRTKTSAQIKATTNALPR